MDALAYAAKILVIGICAAFSVIAVGLAVCVTYMIVTGVIDMIRHDREEKRAGNDTGDTEK